MGLFNKIFNSEKKEDVEKKTATPWIDLKFDGTTGQDREEI